jgi:chromosome segregation ATPase
MRLQFVQLQMLDQQLAQQVQARDAALTALGERDVLQVLKTTVDRLVAQLKEERATSSDLQWALEEIELRLRALHEQEYDGPGDPLAARELALLDKQRTQLEEQVLLQLEYIAELEHTLAQTDHQYAERQAAWAQREPDLQTQLEHIGQTIEALHAEREHVAQQLSPRARAQYDDLQRRHRGTAFAFIHNRQCSMCHARLPAAVFDMLADPAALVRCPRCGRVVYVAD